MTMDKFSGLKAIAEKAKELGGINNYKKGKDAVAAFIAAANPATVLALLAELEAKTKHIADMEQVVAAAKCDDELWDAMAHRLKTLEAKLATLVQASGWISWHGGMFRPVRSDTVIDVMFANGNVKPNICAGSVVFEWQKTPKDSQRVTAYRLHRRGV